MMISSIHEGRSWTWRPRVDSRLFQRGRGKGETRARGTQVPSLTCFYLTTHAPNMPQEGKGTLVVEYASGRFFRVPGWVWTAGLVQHCLHTGDMVFVTTLLLQHLSARKMPHRGLV